MKAKFVKPFEISVIGFLCSVDIQGTFSLFSISETKKELIGFVFYYFFLGGEGGGGNQDAIVYII